MVKCILVRVNIHRRKRRTVSVGFLVGFEAVGILEDLEGAELASCEVLCTVETLVVLVRDRDLDPR